MSSVPTLPKLGEFQQDIILNRGFTCDLTTLRKYEKSRYQEMRLLHIRRDIEIPETNDQVSKLHRFIESLEYRKEGHEFYKRIIHPWFCPDVVIIGHFMQDSDYIKSLSYDLERYYGIFRRWDIMVYFIDAILPNKTENLEEVHEVLKDIGEHAPPNFIRHAEHIVDAHVRRRDDVTTRQGAYVTLFDRMLTESLDSFLGKNNDDTLGQKIGKVEEILNQHGPNKDVDFILKILNFLVSVRNFAIHLGDKAFKNRLTAWSKVRDDIRKGGYLPSCIHSADKPKTLAPHHEFFKLNTILTYRIKDWLEEYTKTQQMG